MVAKRKSEAIEQPTDERVAAFLDLAVQLDRNGESPERLALWKRLICSLRMAGCIGASHQATELGLSRLRGLSPYPPMKGAPNFSTYAEGLTAGWRQRQERAAA